jgi:predicted RNA-binding Zn ribbon-like protein
MTGVMMHVVSKVPAPQTLPLDGQLELVRPPAPGGLELVRRFLNTYDVQRGTEELDSPEALAAWLREQGLLRRSAPFKATRAELARVREIREELRALARRNNGIACDCAFDALEEASGRSHFVFSFDGPGNVARLRAKAPGVDGVIGTILAAVQAAMADKTWPRLKACADETCEFAYYDHSKNGCSRWCSAETCGNRSKVKRYRERQAKGTG